MSRKGIDSRIAGIVFGTVAISATLAMVLIFRPSLPFEFRRDVPKQTLIISHLRQVAFALRTYAADWDDRFPPSAHWESRIAPYVTNIGILILPTEDASNPHRPAFNIEMSGVPMDLIDSPSTSVLVFESDSKAANPAGDQKLAAPFSNAGQTVLVFADRSSRVVEMNRLDEFRWKPVLTPKPTARKPESR